MDYLGNSHKENARWKWTRTNPVPHLEVYINKEDEYCIRVVSYVEWPTVHLKRFPLYFPSKEIASLFAENLVILSPPIGRASIITPSGILVYRYIYKKPAWQSVPFS